jgi:hypothetical protein
MSRRQPPEHTFRTLLVAREMHFDLLEDVITWLR